jgi:hypothetical protein
MTVAALQQERLFVRSQEDDQPQRNRGPLKSEDYSSVLYFFDENKEISLEEVRCRKSDSITTIFSSSKFIATEKELEKLLNESKYILSLKDNWDQEGSKGYVLKTWRKMECFLNQRYYKYISSQLEAPPIPDIEPGPNGGIDLLWEYDAFELLLHIPAEDQGISFFGNNKMKAELKGVFQNEEDENLLFSWIISRMKS